MPMQKERQQNRGVDIPEFGDDIEEYRETIRMKMEKEHPERIYKKRTDEIDVTM